MDDVYRCLKERRIVVFKECVLSVVCTHLKRQDYIIMNLKRRNSYCCYVYGAVIRCVFVWRSVEATEVKGILFGIPGRSRNKPPLLDNVAYPILDRK